MSQLQDETYNGQIRPLNLVYLTQTIQTLTETITTVKDVKDRLKRKDEYVLFRQSKKNDWLDKLREEAARRTAAGSIPDNFSFLQVEGLHETHSVTLLMESK